MCSLAAVGCGDDSGNDDDGSDGGATIEDVSNNVDNLNDQVSEIDDNVKGLNDDVKGLNDDVSQLTDKGKELDQRLDDLENGKGPNCSETEACVPDGLDAVKKGVMSLVERMCALELDCCNDDERNYKFGPGVKTVSDCVATYNDVLANGISPDFLGIDSILNGSVIGIVQAINDDQIKVGLNDKGVKACLDYLDKVKCPQVEEDLPEFCEPLDEVDLDEVAPCSPQSLFVSTQVEGGLCAGPNLAYSDVPTCGKGLVCRQVGAQHGICAAAAAVGDRCTEDWQCDEKLFCNQSTGKCQEKGGVGDACAYVDPSFVSDLNPTNASQAQSLECKPGLDCDPKSKKCVKSCSDGALCSANLIPLISAGPSDCPEDFVCNVTENEGLLNRGYGVCRKPTAKGKKCTPEANECVSGVCGLDGESGDYVCKDALKKAGAACDAGPQPDATCATGYCDSANKCAKATCTYDAATLSYVGCPKDYYCETYQPVGDGWACEPLVDDGDPCNLSGDVQCDSGYCDTGLETPSCAAKLAEDAACSRNAQCPDTQYCNTNAETVVCTDLLADGATCAGVSGECGPNADCIGATCQARAAKGGDCDTDVGPQCKTGLVCATTVYPTPGTAGSCYEPGKFADGAACSSPSDCGSGWCNSNYVCAKLIADGKACDVDDGLKDHCAKGTYCKHPADDPAGKCTKQATAGQKCDPRFDGLDCLGDYEGACVVRHDTFVCETIAVPEGKLFCDGE
jgi:hypothetical protein